METNCTPDHAFVNYQDLLTAAKLAVEKQGDKVEKYWDRLWTDAGRDDCFNAAMEAGFLAEQLATLKTCFKVLGAVDSARSRVLVITNTPLAVSLPHEFDPVAEDRECECGCRETDHLFRELNCDCGHCSKFVPVQQEVVCECGHSIKSHENIASECRRCDCEMLKIKHNPDYDPVAGPCYHCSHRFADHSMDGECYFCVCEKFVPYPSGHVSCTCGDCLCDHTNSGCKNCSCKQFEL